MHCSSNERNSIHLKVSGNLERTSEYDYETHTCYVKAEVKLPKPMSNRAFYNRQTWKKGWNGNEKAYAIAILPDNDSITSGSNEEPEVTASGAVIGSTTALFVLEPLATSITSITQFQMTDLKLPDGFIGDAISNYAAAYALGALDKLLFKYQRKSNDIDSEIRSAFIANIPFAPDIALEYTHLVDECKALVSEFDDPYGKPEVTLKTKSHSGKMSMKSRKTRGWRERSIAIGRSSDIIDASPEVVCSWFYDFCSRDRMRVHREEGNVARLVEKDDGRQQLVATIKHMPWPLNDREFVTYMFWWKDNAGAYYLAAASVDESIDYGVSMKKVRGFVQNLAQIEPYGEVGEDGRMSQCRIMVTQLVDAGGYIPSFIVNSKIALVLSLVESARNYFPGMRKLMRRTAKP